MVSTWSLIYSTTEDSDASKEDIPSSLSSTKSRTQAAELRRASSSSSTSYCATCSTQSRPMASSSQSTSQTRLEGSPRIR
jgi:hypothetical protein